MIVALTTYEKQFIQAGICLKKSILRSLSIQSRRKANRRDRKTENIFSHLRGRFSDRSALAHVHVAAK